MITKNNRMFLMKEDTEADSINELLHGMQVNDSNLFSVVNMVLKTTGMYKDVFEYLCANPFHNEIITYQISKILMSDMEPQWYRVIGEISHKEHGEEALYIECIEKAYMSGMTAEETMKILEKSGSSFVMEQKIDEFLDGNDLSNEDKDIEKTPEETEAEVEQPEITEENTETVVGEQLQDVPDNETADESEKEVGHVIEQMEYEEVMEKVIEQEKPEEMTDNSKEETVYDNDMPDRERYEKEPRKNDPIIPQRRNVFDHIHYLIKQLEKEDRRKNKKINVLNAALCAKEIENNDLKMKLRNENTGRGE